MKQEYKDGVWPVMLTPFTPENQVDYPSLEKLINWYIGAGVADFLLCVSPAKCFYYRWKNDWKSPDSPKK